MYYDRMEREYILAVCITQTTKPIVLAIVVHIEWLFAETNSLVTDTRSRESVHSV